MIIWRKSSFSTYGECVELTRLPSGKVAMRDSRYPLAFPLVFTPGEFKALILGVKAGEFDDFGDEVA